MSARSPDPDRVTIAFGEGGVAHVRLARPDKLNALDDAMLDALVAAGERLASASGLRAVVLAGEGRGFCAGLDLQGLASGGPDGARSLAERTHGNANRFQQAALAWRALPVPVIAAIHGPCFGGGLQIASGADIRIVAPDARLAIRETEWGLVPDMGGYALWRGLVRDDVLRELIYTAREFSGEEALALGFATHIDPSPLERAAAIASAIAAHSPDAIRAAKDLANRAADLALDAILLAESEAQQRLVFSKNQLEAVASRLERRSPRFEDR